MLNNNCTKLAIIHFQPLEYYPPVCNLINTLGDSFSSVKVFSCSNVAQRDSFTPDRPANIFIHKFPFTKIGESRGFRLLKYIFFNLFTLLRLLFFRPNKLLYFESSSAWPAYVYLRFFNSKCQLFIHYHEYESPKDYLQMMTTVRFYHDLEKKWLYSNAKWISQTNADRIQFFHEDHPNLMKNQLRIMPNYPPKSWLYKSLSVKKRNIGSLKLIYVGSLSFQSTYLKEVCEWVENQGGRVLFDIFAYNVYTDVKDYLNEREKGYIRYFEKGIEYQDQPPLLSQYDVGLVLYKAHNQNFTYNAPNKLFEYLACDLDVWYPDVLKGPVPYQTVDTFPKVLPMNCEDMEAFDYGEAIDRTGLSYKPSTYFCEDVYAELLKEISES
ncbi:hypothetical protein [Persicobacter psychrovividus]|uniref:Glycosyltransferase n=1 Tax=Persicobacter psychrovividus TaxID=387638 RepID=A0ABN6L621_9BACT|nr:hypothetical protein PEPS_08900 [Persicobacter psychrovividus]